VWGVGNRAWPVNNRAGKGLESEQIGERCCRNVRESRTIVRKRG